MVDDLGDVVKECSRDTVDKVEKITSGRQYNIKEFNVEEWISDVDWDGSSSDQMKISSEYRELLKALGCYNYNFPFSVYDNIKTVSNGEYQLRSGFRRAANQELIERNNTNIQPGYNVLAQNPPIVPSSQGYFNYISALGRVHRK
ncbi:hypothetical protein INT45_007291 [Circinella minor]|uniref:Uncharacterized protein n=1 Tax=Circinella minor TaxID=1195481 RepID=A0A8H7S7X9_9FUNG|nr:hypothetical protein INT45_007291 [Circinella minor]